MFLWFPVLDLARAPRRTGRKKGSGYENDVEYVASEDNLADIFTKLVGKTKLDKFKFFICN